MGTYERQPTRDPSTGSMSAETLLRYARWLPLGLGVIDWRPDRQAIEPISNMSRSPAVIVSR
jgi:hypothetical protein